MKQDFIVGVVENRHDPLKLGRCQVRIIGLHTEDKSVLPTDKLPWAMPVQDSNSAGISGIGFSPTGLVEGSVVKIEFADPDQQQPFITGTIGGIPQAEGSIQLTDDSITIKDEDGNIPVDNNTNSTTAEATSFKPAKQYTGISQQLLDFIKSKESLRLNSYQDSGGVWTIGYGTTRINGNVVTENMTITSAQAEQYLIADINSDASDAVRKNVNVLLTQSMFDALSSFVYNIGRGNFYKSELRTTLNSGDYNATAGLFGIYNKDNGKVVAGLTNRRQEEKNLFLKDGLPNDIGVIQEVAKTSVGEQTSNGVSAGLTSDNIGFKDPKGIYPLYRNEPDTNRLARHEQIDKTIVRKKEVAREKNIPIAGGGTWNQPQIPYNTHYPFNHVMQTESGHVLEFDDTPNSERIHIYHKKGTFTEIDANGTQVNRIVGDGFEILERNGYVHINGASNVTIDGAHNVRVGGVLNLDVIGNTVINVFNDANVNVSGNASLSVKESFKVKANDIKLEANTIDILGAIKLTGDVDIAADNYSLTADVANMIYNDELHTMIGGDTYNRHNAGIDYSCPADPARSSNVDCSDVDEASNGNSTGLGTPSERQTSEVLSFAPLSVYTRGEEASTQYETPEDGDFTEYQEYQIDKGLIEPEDIDSGTETATESTTENNVAVIDASCDIIFGMEEFPASLQLSKYFTLSALTKNGSRKLVNQAGLTKQEIACNLKQLSVNCLDPIYELYPNMFINSGFRRPGDAPASKATSQHDKGQAADIKFNNFTKEQYYEAIKVIQQTVPHDQLILEYSGSTGVWIHISFKQTGNRKQVFTMRDHKKVSEFGQFKLIV